MPILLTEFVLAGALVVQPALDTGVALTGTRPEIRPETPAAVIVPHRSCLPKFLRRALRAEPALAERFSSWGIRDATQPAPDPRPPASAN